MILRLNINACFENSDWTVAVQVYPTWFCPRVEEYQRMAATYCVAIHSVSPPRISNAAWGMAEVFFSRRRTSRSSERGGEQSMSRQSGQQGSNILGAMGVRFLFA